MVALSLEKHVTDPLDSTLPGHPIFMSMVSNVESCRPHLGLWCCVLLYNMPCKTHHFCLHMASLFTEIDPIGAQRWWTKGNKLHRDDGPAVIYPNGDQEWYRFGERHRDDGPAIDASRTEGLEEWFINGKRHREGDLPAIVYFDGWQSWYKDDKCHRDIGPARIGSSRLDPPRFYEHGERREFVSVKGETLVAESPSSWSPVLYFM